MTDLSKFCRVLHRFLGLKWCKSPQNLRTGGVFDGVE